MATLTSKDIYFFQQKEGGGLPPWKRPSAACPSDSPPSPQGTARANNGVTP